MWVDLNPYISLITLNVKSIYTLRNRDYQKGKKMFHLYDILKIHIKLTMQIDSKICPRTQNSWSKSPKTNLACE